MKGTVTKGLEILAAGLGPYVESRLRERLGSDWSRAGSVAHVINTVDVSKWDAQVVLMLMWENWNTVFRHELSFVERSLVSELREFRNRWAHQQQFTLRDTYRCIDGIERLLRSVGSNTAGEADLLRKETLKLLHDDELSESSITARDWFTACVAAVCGFLIVVVVLEYLRQPLSWVLAALTMIVFSRFVYQTTRAKTVINTGPRHCGNCSRVFYGGTCPYCQPPSTTRQGSEASSIVVAG